MKKFLSLVLALVMTMSLVTISAGAKDFTDDASVKYAEGVKVMDLLGVINGYEDGSFKPANTLTRGAAAKIICNLLLTPSIADTLPADKTGFKDVPATNTFAKYIAYCGNAGIINGYRDGTFRPAATLTGFAFMKMLMGALGYDAQIEGFTGDTFAVNVAAKVGELKLAKGNDTFVGTKAVTREEACLYAFNTLSAAMVKYASKGTKITVNGVEIIQGASAAEKIMDDSGYYTFQEAKFAGLKESTSKDDFGRVYKTWTYGKTTIKLLASNATKVYYGTLEGKTLYKDLDLTTGKYTVNGVEKTGTEIKAMSWGGLGYMVEVYYTEKTNAITIIPVEYKLGEVTGIVKATEDAGRQIKLKASDGEATTGTAMTFETDSYAKGDMVLYTYTNKKVQSVQAVKTLEGIVSESKGTKLTIGGAKYDSLKDLKLAAGSEGTFYLGVDNAIVGFTGKAAVTSSNFAYIYSLVKIDSGYDEDGLVVAEGQRAYFVKADGTKGNAVVSSKSAKIEKDTVIAYSINANGEISVAKPAAGTGTTGTFKTANIGKSYNKVEGFYMSSATKFVFVDTSKGLSITTVDGYKNVVDQKDVKVYVVADGVNAKYVFVQAKAASATSDAKYGFLLDTVPSVRKAADNSDLYVFSVMIDGNNKAELISSDAKAFEDKNIAKNARFSYTEKDGKLASVEAAPAKAEWSGKDHYVEVVGEGYLGLKGVNDTVTLADKCVVYEYDAATNTYAESTVAVNSILNVYVNAKNEVTMIVIVGEHEAD